MVVELVVKDPGYYHVAMHKNMHVKPFNIFLVLYQEIDRPPARVKVPQHLVGMGSACICRVPGYILKDPGKYHGTMYHDL